LNVTRQKRAALRDFSSCVAKGTIELECVQDLEEFKLAVQRVKGIGAWSAEYMALRALGDTDAFPGTDLVLRRFLRANPTVDPDAARPWRGYLSVYLWNEYGHISPQERKRRNAVL
jgi:AraC family transcriptional regulator of adaptative response / DNA-3-methyladenine glycosylase II